MEPQPLEEVVRNVDMRLTRVEQILPTLATKAELQEAIAPLATKEELRVAIAEAIAPLATKVELREAIAEAIAPLATRAELQGVRSELREEMRHEGERTRRHFDVVSERLEGHIRLIAEGQVLLQERFEDLRTDLKADIAQLDRRVMRLEAAR
jgi:type I site-specific restriction endonuclease